jgi:hypothetical protein
MFENLSASASGTNSMAASTSSTILINFPFLIQSTDFKALYTSLLHKPVKNQGLIINDFEKLMTLAIEIYVIFCILPGHRRELGDLLPAIQNCFTLFLY